MSKRIGETYDVFIDGQADPLRVVVDGRDVRKWEATTEGNWLEERNFTAHTHVAYYAAVRSGVWNEGMTEWMDRCVEMRLVQEGEPADPTQSAPTGGP